MVPLKLPPAKGGKISELTLNKSSRFVPNEPRGELITGESRHSELLSMEQLQGGETGSQIPASESSVGGALVMISIQRCFEDDAEGKSVRYREFESLTGSGAR